MKRTSLVPICALLLLMLALPCARVSGFTPPTQFRGTSAPIAPGASWVLDLGYNHAGMVAQWRWNSTGDVTFDLVYTRASDFKTIPVRGLQKDDGHVSNVTGWYALRWINNATTDITVSYVVDIFTPVLSVTSFPEGAYLNSRTVTVSGVTEGFATGVVVGIDPAHLENATVNGKNWSATLTLPEGRSTIFSTSYYWLRPMGACNLTLNRTTNVTVDTIPPWISITSPTNGMSIRGRTVQLYWSCSDTVGVGRVDLKVDNGSWITVSWGSTLGLAYTTLGLPTGTHTIELRGVDRAGNTALASVTVTTDANDWSFGGPMCGLPTVAAIGAPLVLGLVALWSYTRPAEEPGPPQTPRKRPPQQ